MGASGDTIRLGIEVDEQGQARQLIAALNREIAQLRAQMLALGASVNNQAALGSQRQLAQIRALQQALAGVSRSNQQVGASGPNASRAVGGVGSAAEFGAAALRRLVAEAAAVVTAFAGFRAFEAFVRQGIEFDKTIESATLGIGALITSQAQLRNSDGRVLEGAEALAAAQGIAADQLAKLRAEGLKTHATMSDLVLAFQQAVGVSLRFGFSLDQARQFTVGMVRAAFALQLPLGQLQEEIRDFLQGNINPRNTRIASALGISNEQVRAAQQAGTLFDFVTKKLEAFNAAGDATAQTFVGITSNAKQFLEVFAGAATKPLFDEFKRGAQAALAGVFDLDTATVSKNFSAILDVATDIFGRLGGVLSDALTGAVDQAKAFNDWLRENEGAVSDLVDALGLAASAMGAIVADSARLAVGLTASATQAGFLKTELLGVGLAAALIDSGIQGIEAAFRLVYVLALGLVAAFGLMVKLDGLLVGVVNRDLGNALKKAGDNAVDFAKRGVKSFEEYAVGVARTGDAIDQYTAAVKALDQQEADAAGARKARDQLRDETATLRDESKRQEQALKASLDKRLISRADYAAKLRVIQLSEVRSEEQATLSAIRATTDPRLKRALFDQITALHQRRALLESGTTVIATPAPEADKSRQDRLRLLNQKADDEIRAAKSLADSLVAQRTAAFDAEMAQAKNQFDTREAEQLTFTLDLEKIQFDSLEKQKRIQQQRADALAGVEGQESNRQKALDNIKELGDAENKLQDETDAKIAVAHRQALDARKRLDEQGVKDEIELLQQRGEIVKATALQLEAQYKDELDALAKRTDAGARQQEAAIHQIIDTSLLKAQFEELDKSATDALTHLSQKEGEITSLQQNGAISQREARRETIALYKETADQVGQLLPQLRDIAERSGDRESIARVKALESQFAELNATVSQVDENLRKLGTASKDALEQGLAQGLDAMTDGVHSFADAWGEAAGSVIAALRRIASQMLATLIIEKSLSFLGGLFGGSSSSGSLLQRGVDAVGGGNTAVGAEGAYIDVPGRPTDRDTIPAMLANREFVVNADATAKAGPDALAAINRGDFDRDILRSILRLGQIPRAKFIPLPIHRAQGGPAGNELLGGSVRGYAEGGLVAAPPLAGLQAGGLFRFILEHSEDVIIRKMESPPGQQVTLRTLKANRNAASLALGST